MKRSIITSVLFILTATVWHFCLYAAPLKISKETTYITTPLMSDGKRIDYFRAMEDRHDPPEMKTDDNGYRILVRAIGDPAEYTELFVEGELWKSRPIDNPEPLRLQTYEKLGLDPTIKPTIKLESADTVWLRHTKEHPEEADQWSNRFYRPWTFDDVPMLKDWYKENTAGLDMLGKAVRKPVFYVPMVRESDDDALIEGKHAFARHFVFREFARALSARAYYRIGTGDIDGAIEDVISIYLLARHTAKHGTHADCLVGIAIEGMAAAISIGGNPAAPPSRVQLQRLFDAIRSLPPMPKIDNCGEAERLMAMSILQEYAFGRQPNSLMVAKQGPWSADVDWDFIFREAHKNFELVGAGKETPESIVERLRKVLGEEPIKTLEDVPVKNTLAERTEVALGILAFHVVPAPRSDEAERRRQCAENMKLLTLALLLYEKEHGKLPDGDWRAAIKPYLAGTPTEETEKYFRCPSHIGLAEDETTYAMIRRKSGETPTTPYMLLLVETVPPMKMSGNDGTIPELKAKFDKTEGLGSNHPGGITVSDRSGSVRFMTTSISTDKLQSHIDGTAEMPW